MIFIDATFGTCPKQFYQVLNMIRKLKDKFLNIKIITVILNSKNENSYINEFENFKLLLLENKINIDFNKIYFMADFEEGLRNRIKYSFQNSILLGCYFHYIKSIFNKIKKLGLIKKIFCKYI